MSGDDGPSDPTLVIDGTTAVVTLASWTGPIPPDHPDANFLTDVATWSLADPIATIAALATNLGLPVGAVVRYVLAKWVSDGSSTILEVGPAALQRLRAIILDAQQAGTDHARLAAFDALAEQLSWLGHGLDDPEGTYPTGGART